MSTASTMFVFGGMMFALWMVASMLLRASCAMNGVRRPRMVGAAVLTLLAAAAGGLAHMTLSTGLGMTAQGLGMSSGSGARLVLMLGVPVHMLAAASAYRLMLPATFGKATSVWIVQMLALAALAVGFDMLMTTLVPDAWAQMRGAMGM